MNHLFFAQHRDFSVNLAYEDFVVSQVSLPVGSVVIFVGVC